MGFIEFIAFVIGACVGYAFAFRAQLGLWSPVVALISGIVFVVAYICLHHLLQKIKFNTSVSTAMHTADLILYPVNEDPTRLLRVDCDQCLHFLIPYLQSCRSSRRIAGAIAEIHFASGAVVWFGSEDGAIDLHCERPRFGHARRLLGFIPAPMRRESQAGITDDAIQQAVRSAYQSALDPQ
jgi:hypothetical protein